MTEITQHSQDSIAFKESYQCPDDLYEYLRSVAIDYLRANTDAEHIDLSKVNLRRFMFEDGVISFDATHPHITHEDEIETSIEFSIDEDAPEPPESP